jgi:hypothetical protein
MGTLAATAVLACSLPLLAVDLNLYDEGLIALGGEQLLKGHWPLVDFYTPYPPGAYFVLALAYKLFGVQVLVERGLALALTALAAGLGAALATEPERAAAARAVEILALLVGGLGLSAVWVPLQVAGALATLLGAALLLRSRLERGRPADAVPVGALLGLAALWRADFALYAAVGSAVTWLWCASEPVYAHQRLSRRLAGVGNMAASAAAVALPVFALFVALGGRRAFASLFIWPVSGTYHATLPWPPLWPPLPPATARAWLPTLAARLSSWPFYFPIVVAGVGALRAGRRRGPRRPVDTWLFVTGACFAPYVAGRTDYTHLFVLLFLSLLLAARYAGHRRLERARWSPAAWTAALTLLAIPLAFTLRSRVPDAVLVDAPFARAKGIRMPAAIATPQRALVEALRELPPAQPIFSGTQRHDVFVVNDIMLYFLAERDPGTYYWCLDSGVTTSAAVQREMIDELRQRQVGAVVRFQGAVVADRHLPDRSGRLLDDYLASAFGPPTDIAPYQLLRARR